ncbi:MAG: transglycosylase domain-containing protein [Treponema sp.]
MAQAVVRRLPRIKNRSRAAVLAVLLLCVCGYGSLFLPFPALEAFRQCSWSTRIYDRGGNLIQILALENGIRREFTALKNMPPDALAVFLAAEDKAFFTHAGIDFKAIARAAYQNSIHGKRISGASTITMQVARLLAPSKQRTLFAKLREAWYALRIERKLSKDEILELYLNHVPFGFQTEGITSAARNFFALPLAELSKEQLCCLAVIPRRPAGYTPLEHPKACAEKAALLYRSVFMQQGGQAAPAAAQEPSITETIEDRLLAAAQTARRFTYPFYMPHYIAFLVNQYKQGAFAQTATTAAKAPHPLPPEWHLTADQIFSTQAGFILQSELRKTTNSRLHNGAILVIENATGNIVAWVGSNSYFDREYNGQIDGVTARNQSGSSTKPFLYALALDRGYKPSDILPDIPMQFGSKNIYIPRNFNNCYNGPVRLRTALASSLNIPAVMLLDEMGEAAYLETLEKLKLQLAGAEADQAGLSLALGSVPVSLYELVRAFSVFPRDGIILPLKSFQDGGSPDAFSAAEAVYSPDTVRIICSILSDPAARVKGFGFAATFRTPFPALFKTGTANQYQSLVALAASSAYTIGVWMGNFSGNTVMGKTGSSVPARIARRLLTTLHSKPLSDGTMLSAKPFAEPVHWKKEPVCVLSGMRATPLCPNAVPEYLPTAAAPCPFCTWHQNQNGSITAVYPEEYQRWISVFARSGSIGTPKEKLTIVRPKNGSRFFDGPRAKDKASGIIPLEVIGGTEATAHLFYDSRPPFTLTRPFFSTLPLEKGKHRIVIRCGSEEASTEFTVE